MAEVQIRREGTKIIKNYLSQGRGYAEEEGVISTIKMAC